MNIDRRVTHIRRVEAVRKAKIRLAMIVLSVLFFIALILVIVNAGRAEEGIGRVQGNNSEEMDFGHALVMEDSEPEHSQVIDIDPVSISIDNDDTKDADGESFGSGSSEPESSSIDLQQGPKMQESTTEELEPEHEELVIDFVISEEDYWKILLVNWENPVPNNFETRLYHVEGNFLIDHRVVKPLQNMLAAMREEGLSPLLVSAHRCRITQTTLFENNVARNMGNNMTREEAEREAARVVAAPGTSEHEIGLAVDIVATHYQNLTESFGWTPEGIWMANYGANFGFILRYPRNTEDITGIIFEPWHLRYVGVEVAQFIMENNLTLEEFLEKYFR